MGGRVAVGTIHSTAHLERQSPERFSEGRYSGEGARTNREVGSRGMVTETRKLIKRE